MENRIKGSFKNQIKILLLEDCKKKIEQILEAITSVSINTTVSITECYSDFIGVINREEFDLIVADLMLPMFTDSSDEFNITSKLIENFFLSDKQANSVLDMPLRKLTNLEKNQIYKEIKNLEEKKNYFQKLLNERELLLELLIEELLKLKKTYNVTRKTKLRKNIDQNEELETINNQILEDLIKQRLTV